MLVTYEQLMVSDPFFDQKNIGMPTDYSDTVVNFIQDYRHKFKYQTDFFKFLLHKNFLKKREVQLFITTCARQVQHLITDQRSIDALDVAERYLNGNATKHQLNLAKKEHWAAWYDSRDYCVSIDESEIKLINRAKATHRAMSTIYDVISYALGGRCSAFDAVFDYADAIDYASQHKKNTYEKAINYKIDQLLEIFKAKERKSNVNNL